MFSGKAFRGIAEQVGQVPVDETGTVVPFGRTRKDRNGPHELQRLLDQPNLEVALIGRFREVVAEVEIEERIFTGKLFQEGSPPEQASHVSFLGAAAGLDLSAEITAEKQGTGYGYLCKE